MDRVYVRQLVRSFRCGEISRRTFLQRATVLLGSAAAHMVLAACASTPADAPSSPVVQEETPEQAAASVTVSEEGLITENVTYPDAEGNELMGYLARPETEGALPAVVVIQEWWGLNEHIRDVARRFASEGFVALAPDLYGGVSTTEPDEAQKLAMDLDTEAAVQEIDQAAAFLLEQEFVTGGQVGVVGFCMGGGLSLRAGSASENVGAVVAFYGRTPPAEEIAEIQAPVLGLYGAEDGGIPVSDVEAMEETLNEAGIENEIHIYEGAEHAFFNETRQSYNAEAAEDAWPRTLAWFREHLTSG
jgi:carboxymethylenebutenolidase